MLKQEIILFASGLDAFFQNQFDFIFAYEVNLSCFYRGLAITNGKQDKNSD